MLKWLKALIFAAMLISVPVFAAQEDFCDENAVPPNNPCGFENVCADPDTVFCDDWEDGDLQGWSTSWTPCGTGGLEACIIGVGGADNTPNALRVSVPDTSPDTAFPGNQPSFTPYNAYTAPLFMRWYIKYEDGYQFMRMSDGQKMIYMRGIREGNPACCFDDDCDCSPGGSCDISCNWQNMVGAYGGPTDEDVSQFQIVQSVHNHETKYLWNGTAPKWMDSDVWYCLEWETQCQSAYLAEDGYTRIWVNGELYLEHLNVDMDCGDGEWDPIIDEAPWISSYYGGNPSPPHPQQYVYYDQIVTSTARIGCPDVVLADCGDGVIEGAEQCDCGDPWNCDTAAEVDDETCITQSYPDGGTLDCIDSGEINECRFDFSACNVPDCSIDIDDSTWTITADSEEPCTASPCSLSPGDLDIDKAFDEDDDTKWHTEWNANSCDGGQCPPHPHCINIDLGVGTSVCGFRYTPRNDSPNGKTRQYAIQKSTVAGALTNACNDDTNWTTIGSDADLGELVTEPNDTTDKEVLFGVEHQTQYLRFKPTLSVNNDPWASAAEFNLLKGEGPDCGNSAIDIYERCDCGGDACTAAELDNQTCVTLGYASGTLGCLDNCLFHDTTQCVSSGSRNRPYILFQRQLTLDEIPGGRP